jgi:hypothetical protein
VAAALTAVPSWDAAICERPRAAAESLDGKAVATDPADRLQVQADRLTPDPRRLQALALRKQIVLAAGPHPMEGWP